MDRKRWFTSSANPAELSLTIKGMLMMYVPAVLLVAENFNLPLSETQLVSWISDGSFVIASAMILYGFLRKVWKWLNSRFNIL